MEPPKLPLPKSWSPTVCAAILHVIALARFVAENDGLRSELARRDEEIRIKDARMARLDPHRRPHYPPTERMAILQLRTADGWSQQRTADVFQVTAATIASWCRRLDEEGPKSLVRTPEPVNRFPDFVTHTVRLLKLVCPWLGKRKIADFLARAGLHLGTSTVQRMLTDNSRPAAALASTTGRHHSAKGPNDVWHVDLTAVPIGHGFWTSWLPFAMPQKWPFCWWVAVVVDGFSRRVLGVAVFEDRPTSVEVRAFLGRTVHSVGQTDGLQSPPNTSGRTARDYRPSPYAAPKIPVAGQPGYTCELNVEFVA